MKSFDTMSSISCTSFHQKIGIHTSTVSVLKEVDDIQKVWFLLLSTNMDLFSCDLPTILSKFLLKHFLD